MSVGQGGEEPLVPGLHPTLTPADPLQGITVQEHRVECTVVSAPKGTDNVKMFNVYLSS